MPSMVTVEDTSYSFEFSDSYAGNFERGLRNLKKDNLDVAEKALSHAVKILSSSSNSSHLNEEKAQCFHTMAEIYLTRASKQLDKSSFCEMIVKSIALFESERIYRYGSYIEDKEINEAIFEAELKLIDKVFGPNGVEHFRKTSCEKYRKISNRENLAKIRSKLVNEYFPKLDEAPDWNVEDEEKRCFEIESIYKQIQDDMKGFLFDILTYCSEIAGRPSCSFSIIGLGSMSRQEITPYSDLEFSILVDNHGKIPSPEQRQYFRFLTYLLQVEVIKLGETILPSIGISSLNDFYSSNKEDDWFYDAVTPKGFSFDGMMPWACKTPLGRKEWRGQPQQEYIMTVDEMLTLQDTIHEGMNMDSLKTANVFCSVCHLFGEEEITKTYQQRLSSILTHPDRVKRFQEQVLQIMRSLLETYSLKNVNTADFGTQQDVKKEVYRLTSLLVEQLSIFFGIFGQSSWKCIDEMKKRNILTEVGAKNLRTALSITTELRLRCYEKQGRQKEALPIVPQLSVDEERNLAPSPFLTAIVRLYHSLTPLTSVVSQILDEIERNRQSLLILLPSKPDISEIREIILNHEQFDPETLVVEAMKKVDFLDVSPLTTAIAYLRVLDLPRAFDCLLSAKDDVANPQTKAQILVVLAECYRNVGKFVEASECVNDVEILYSRFPCHVGKREFFDALSIKMSTYVDEGVYDEAVKIYEKINDFKDQQDIKEEFGIDKEIDYINSSAVLFMRRGQYVKAEDLLRTALNKLEKQQRCYKLCYFMCLNNLATCLLNQGRLTEAKTVSNNAFKAAGELYGQKAIHPCFANCLTNLAEVHFDLHDIEEADRLLQLALIIYSYLHQQELIEPGVIEALIIKARIHQIYAQWDEMLDILTEAKKTSEMLYKCFPHPNIVSILFYLGFCQQARGNVSEALKHYQEYLKISENEKMGSKKSRHDCNSAYVLQLIACLGEDFPDSSYRLSCIKKAVEIEEEIHGKDTKHDHLATCVGALGYCLITVGSETKGFEYLCKAMEMFEELNLDINQEACGQRRVLTIAKLLGEHSPDKAEVHLRTAETVIKKSINDDSHIALLQINSSLLVIFLETNRINEGLELAKKQRCLLDAILSKYTVPDGPQLLQLLNLALFYEDSGRRNTAKDIYLDVIRRLEELVDPNDPKKDYLMLILLKAHLRVGDIYLTNGMYSEAEATLHRIASFAQKTTSQRPFLQDVYHVALCILAATFTKTGRYLQAHELLDILINIYEENSESINVKTASKAFLIRGELSRLCCHFDLAMHDLKEALKVIEKSRESAINKSVSTSENEIQYARIMNSIGLVHEQTNNLECALKNYLCCVNIVEWMPPTLDAATFHQNLGDVLKKLNRLDEALIHFTRSLEIREMLHVEDPVREDIATVMYHISVIQYMSERYEDASKTLDKLIPLRKELLKVGGNLQNYCAALVMKGNCHIVHKEEAHLAKDAYDEAEKILEWMTEGQPNLDYARVLSNMGYACYLLNQWKEATGKLEKALWMKRIIYEDTNLKEIAIACRLLAKALLKQHEYQKALPYFKEALGYFEASDSPDDEIRCVLNISLCYKGLKDLRKALESLKRIEKLCVEKLVSDKVQVDFHIAIADVFLEEECEEKYQGLYHLKKAEAILIRIEQSEMNLGAQLIEIQAKILSLGIS